MQAIILAKQLGDMGAHQLSACPKKKTRWYGQANTTDGRTFAHRSFAKSKVTTPACKARLTWPSRAQTTQSCCLTVFAF